jgi:hypothetical protein
MAKTLFWGIICALILGAIFIARRREKFSYKNVTCHQLCDMQHPNTLNYCSAGGDREAERICTIFHTCVTDCEYKQDQERDKSNFGLAPYTGTYTLMS